MNTYSGLRATGREVIGTPIKTLCRPIVAVSVVTLVEARVRLVGNGYQGMLP